MNKYIIVLEVATIFNYFLSVSSQSSCIRVRGKRVGLDILGPRAIVQDKAVVKNRTYWACREFRRLAELLYATIRGALLRTPGMRSTQASDAPTTPFPTVKLGR